MLEVNYHELGEVSDEKLEFAIIGTTFCDKWVFVKHKDRTTWEIPGGHREYGEDINHTAKRELYEETGAKECDVIPLCEYSVTIDNNTRYGRLFYAEAEKVGDLPNMEIKEVGVFHELPENLTYKEIQPIIFEKLLNWQKNI
ncbi:NUDIX hydrolase [Anaeromicrobium sediminis]|uniref:NUDIX hydrolase n=1 Tax=Anaeromicrobium sediminis TaxID=1478221 RepID=A0A267MDL6_9FIRM|nr:NUDIX domain-containing protein [Anaeromicrobium sediminis]PAB57557.1 NUDIX hydrolase [Anaeromicrobium sediminis]